MKILQLIPNLSGGGAERFVVDLSNELVKQNEVVLITLYDKGENDLFLEFLDERIKNISLGKRFGFDRKIVWQLYKIINQEAPNIIHTHLRVFNYLVPLMTLLGKTPIIHTVHNDAFKECPNKVLREFRKLCFKRKNVQAVTISQESSRSFKKAYRGISDKLIYNGRKKPLKTAEYKEVVKEISLLRNDKNTKIFINIGRFSAQKNHLMLIRAFNLFIKREKANAILLIIGGKRKNQVSLQIQNELKKIKKKEGAIYLIDECKNATDYLFLADFFCLSSLFEGMPITLIESFATGTIPVCTPVGGIPEMIGDLDNGLLSKDTTVESYYEILKKVYYLREEQQSQLQHLGINTFENKYSIQLCAAEYLLAYNELKTIS